jgi:hypothetical protein
MQPVGSKSTTAFGKEQAVCAEKGYQAQFKSSSLGRRFEPYCREDRAMAVVRSLLSCDKKFAILCGKFADKRRGAPNDFVVKSHIYGRRLLAALGPDNDGFTKCVAVRIDGSATGISTKDASRRFVEFCNLFGIPTVSHTDQLGTGIHVRCLFSDPVPAFLARDLFASVLIASGLKKNVDFRSIWPFRKVKNSSISLPYNKSIALENGGGLAVLPGTIEPLRAKEQLSVVETAHRISIGEFHAILRFIAAWDKTAGSFIRASFEKFLMGSRKVNPFGIGR